MQASLCMVVRGGFILCMVVVVVGVGSLLPSTDTETQFKQREPKPTPAAVSCRLYSTAFSTLRRTAFYFYLLLYSTLIYSTVQYSTAIADDRRPTKPRSPNHLQHTGRGHHHHPSSIIHHPSSSNPAIQQSSARCMCNCACPVWPL